MNEASELNELITADDTFNLLEFITSFDHVTVARNVAMKHLQRGKLENRVAEAKIILEEAEVNATPETGWPGSNPEMRKAARDRGLLLNTHYANRLIELVNAEHELRTVNAEIKAMEALVAGVVRGMDESKNYYQLIEAGFIKNPNDPEPVELKSTAPYPPQEQEKKDGFSLPF